MNKSSTSAALGALALFAASLGAVALAAPGAPPTPPPLATAPPPIPIPSASSATVTFPNSTPIPFPSGFGMPGAKPGAKAPLPPKSARKGIEGVWEVQIQHDATTVYTHFNITSQADNVLSGIYRNQAGKVFPLSGSVDGQNVRMVVSLPNGTTLLLQAHLDGTSDMVGSLTSAKGEVYFTASWRPKEKFIQNISPGTGGLGGTGLPNGGPP